MKFTYARTLICDEWAPELLYVGKENADIYKWHVIIMDYVDGEPLCNISLLTEKWQQVTKQVKEIISILHRANLVFGNLHSTKIMVNQNDREPKVKLVGFSWAGKEGEV